MMMYLPEEKALCLSEVAVKLMHNVYTIRGAKVRDALVWSKHINETLDLFPDTEVFEPPLPDLGPCHDGSSWQTSATPTVYHDRALNPANQGETMPDLANASFFPKGLAADASSHGTTAR